MCAQRVKPGRALRQPKEVESREAVGDIIRKLICCGAGEGALVDGFNNELLTVYTNDGVSCFGMVGGQEVLAYEKDLVPTVRINVTGSRQVTFVSVQCLADFARNNPGLAGLGQSAGGRQDGEQGVDTLFRHADFEEYCHLFYGIYLYDLKRDDLHFLYKD